MLKLKAKHRGFLALAGAAIAGALGYVGYRERYALGLGVKPGDNVLVPFSALKSTTGQQLTGLPANAEVIVNVTNATAAWTAHGVTIQGNTVGMPTSAPGVRPPTGSQAVPATAVSFPGSAVLDVQPAGTSAWKV